MIISLVIILAVLAAVAGFVRWAVSDGTREADPWLLEGELRRDIADAEAARAWALPGPDGLRVLLDGEGAESARSVPWSAVAVEEIGPCLVFTGQFGSLICPTADPGGATSLARILALRGAGGAVPEL